MKDLIEKTSSSFLYFYRTTSICITWLMLSQKTSVRPSVSPSVCLSIDAMYWVKTVNDIVKLLISC